ncbi:MAG: HD domain-containing protein [Chloroflexota bacterium]
MTKEDLASFRQWFSRYCSSFYTDDLADQKNISLKEEHTGHVCENMRLITGELSLEEGLGCLAEAVALFHDVGRFPQYRDYKTFLDSASVNHGLLGFTVLKEEGILNRLPQREQGLILDAVKFHNAFSVPRLEDPDSLFILKLIRDADKLDIWRVFVEHYESPSENRATAVFLGFPDLPGYSRDILSCLYEKRIASLAHVTTLNDFKLLQMSWVYDLNFRPTFRLLSERGYVGRILSTLPHADEIVQASAHLRQAIETKLHG